MADVESALIQLKTALIASLRLAEQSQLELIDWCDRPDVHWGQLDNIRKELVRLGEQPDTARDPARTSAT